MHITQTTGCLAAPDESLAGIDLQRIAAQAPAGELQTDVAYDGLALQPIRDPSRRQLSIVLPFRQFVVIVAA